LKSLWVEKKLVSICSNSIDKNKVSAGGCQGLKFDGFAKSDDGCRRQGIFAGSKFLFVLVRVLVLVLGF